ncbi:MAG: bifunctional DNA-formamidopyrimidine glycosylase/DNA-(apurinic or apyrimidinic site) lyase [candidate division Zixibacteria bacterium]|nr:bifunctional DNA-formamidopyrimidine glycosylase/DNA-(apurinic or apyrimidinic site) lyase [candidate division Zixibacteria bacterium]
MPELPEVETVVRGLRRTVLGKTIAKVQSSAPPKSIQLSDRFGRTSFADTLRGRRIEHINRRGKNILMALSGDITLWVHLKMTGRFLFVERSYPVHKHDLVVIDFMRSRDNDNRFHLRFNDYRRFGRLHLFSDDELWLQKGLASLGPEPLQLSADEFVGMCRTRHRMIKSALLDQTFLAGLGNIYADEVLFASRIHPERILSSISEKKLRELHGHIQRLLKKAIRLMGTTVDSFAGLNGRTGRFQRYLLAYGREGAPCTRCGTKIIRKKIGSRSAHFCGRCQLRR